MIDPLERALDALRSGGLVVIPTDTVYGIAAIPSIPGAVAAIFRAKGRPEDKPLPVLVATADDVSRVAAVDARAQALGERFWPGPLTLILPRAPEFDYDLGGDRADTVAVRVPDCAPALELLARTGPLALTSANRSGQTPATTVAAAREALGDWVDVFVDGGTCDGPPSTVAVLTNSLEILRAGPIARSDLDQTLTS